MIIVFLKWKHADCYKIDLVWGLKEFTPLKGIFGQVIDNVTKLHY